jgi:hypothetical protein
VAKVRLDPSEEDINGREIRVMWLGECSPRLERGCPRDLHPIQLRLITQVISMRSVAILWGGGVLKLKGVEGVEVDKQEGNLEVQDTKFVHEKGQGL